MPVAEGIDHWNSGSNGEDEKDEEEGNDGASPMDSMSMVQQRHVKVSGDRVMMGA